MIIDMTITVKGNTLQGRTGETIRYIVNDVKRAVADQASAEVHQIADRSFKHPTPYYETQIHRFQRNRDEVVGDRGVVYGPWLEGESERNRTTRFKGYHLWRKATQVAQRRVNSLARPIIRQYREFQ